MLSTHACAFCHTSTCSNVFEAIWLPLLTTGYCLLTTDYFSSLLTTPRCRRCRGRAVVLDRRIVLQGIEVLEWAGNHAVAGFQPGLDDRVRRVAGANGDWCHHRLVVHEAIDHRRQR